MADNPTIQTAPVAGPELPNVGSPVLPASPEPEKAPVLGQPEGSVAMPATLPNTQQEWESGAAGFGTSPKPDKWEKVLGGLKQGVQDSFSNTLARKYLQKSAETGTMLPMDQANKLNPYRQTPYTTPVDSGIVAMEAADGLRRQQLAEWMGRNDLSGGGFGRFVGAAATDLPLYASVGLLTGGLGELAANTGGAIAGTVGRAAGYYGAALGEFSAIGQAQNKINATLGDREKSFTEVVQDNLVGAGIAAGLGALARRFLNREGISKLEEGVKKAAGAMENDERPPAPPSESETIGQKKAGVSVDPTGEKIAPTVITSPLQEAKLYAATHGDGTPALHEYGLGEGTQLTDSREVANNLVASSSDTPGQIGETKLPENTKLLDLDRTAGEDYSTKDGFLKALEEKSGVPLDHVIGNGETIKDVVTNLGDYAGVGSVPEDILKQAQEVAKAQGYDGYQFDAENSRTVHLFDAASKGMEVSNVVHADPQTVPGNVSTEQPPSQTTPEAAEIEAKQKAMNYSPNVAQALDEIRKTSMSMHPGDLEAKIADTEKIISDQKQMLSKMAEENPELQDALKELREQEAHDKRMLDVAKRIIDCGATE